MNINQMFLYQVLSDFNSIQVADWISGLDPCLAPYAQKFINKKIDGRRLLNFYSGDLLAVGVDKVGDQVLLADAIQSLRNELESDRVTAQTLASNVAVRSKTYRSELTSSRAKKNFISNESLASASYLLDAGKTLLRWLTRIPFLGVPVYDEIANKMTKHLFELAMLSQRDSFADNAIEEVQYLCTKIIEICDNIINAKDSLTIQPAAVDVITIRKRHEQELGLQFESSYFGLHMVSGVNLASPAQQSGHLERGDEILQVNLKLVVGWTQAALVNLLYENPCEVILTVKRRPRHASNSLGHMYLRPSKLPGRNSKSKLNSGTIHPKNANPSYSNIAEDDDETVTDDSQLSPPTFSSTNPPEVTVTSAAETRFWKLYPKPRNLLRRRATVTGASPTSTRPPVTFTSESSNTSNQKPSVSGSRHRLEFSLSAPERNILEKQKHSVEETLRLFIGDSNVRGSRVTLPFVGSAACLEYEPTNVTINETSFTARENKGKDKKPINEQNKDDSLDDVFESPVENKGEATQLSSIQATPNIPTINQPSTMTSPTIKNSQATSPVNAEQPQKKVAEDVAQSSVSESPTKPQSLDCLTNVVGGGGDDSKPEPLYTGYLHQRQPHWKFGGPRWTRCRASVDSQCFHVVKPELEIVLSSSSVTLASEVHSRPFAFKIEDKKVVHYFAAESQGELNIWIGYLSIDGGISPRGRGGNNILNRSMSVQPDAQRHLSSSSPSSDRQRRSSLPHSQLQYQVRKRLSKLQSSSSTSCSASSILMEDKLRFWNSTSPSPTHKSNISSITITSCKRNQQSVEVPKKKQVETQRAKIENSCPQIAIKYYQERPHFVINHDKIPPVLASTTMMTSGAESGSTGSETMEPKTIYKRPSLDSPTKKCRMGVTMLLRRKGSDSVNNNDTCGTCGRSYVASADKSTQTEEVVLIFSSSGVDGGESRI